jgi:hypothetical protein
MYEVMAKGIEVSEDLKEEFEDLMADSATLQAKYISFCSAIHEEQKKVAVRAKEVWAEAMFTMNLEGKWRYEDGKVYPVDEPATK